MQNHPTSGLWAVVDSLEGEVAGPMARDAAEAYARDNSSYFAGHLTIARDVPDAVLVPPAPYSLPAIELLTVAVADVALDDELEPYCTECGAWIGMFLGMDSWHHFRGDPAPGGQRDLYDADHDAAVAWRMAIDGGHA